MSQIKILEQNSRNDGNKINKKETQRASYNYSHRGAKFPELNQFLLDVIRASKGRLSFSQRTSDNGLLQFRVVKL